MAEIAVQASASAWRPPAIEGTHELVREPLAKWTVGDERLQPGDGLVVVAEREVGIAGTGTISPSRRSSIGPRTRTSITGGV